MISTMRYLVALAACCFTFGCAHTGSVSARASTVDTIITFTGPGLRGSSFPQIRDSTRIIGGSIRASPDAPLCSVTADTTGWPRVATTISSRYLRAISLRLPPSFTPHPVPPPPEVPEGSTKYWEHILGSWDSFQGAWLDIHPGGFAVWIGPTEGYPLAGIGGGEVEQVAYAECRLQTLVGNLPIVLFAVRSPSAFLSGYYVITYWEVEPGVYVRASGDGPDSLSQAQLLAALATITVTR